MSKARRTEGPRAPLFYSVLCLLSSAAGAQTVDLSELEYCAGLATDALKLSCFEAVIAAGRPAGQSDTAGVAELQPEAPAAPVAEVNSGTQRAPVPVVPAAAPAVIAIEQRHPTEAASAAGEESSVPTVAEAATAVTPAEDAFGREHLAASTNTAEQVLHAKVLQVTEGNHDALIFHLSNGQVWRQIEPRRYPHPRNREFDATITKGMMGEYQLQVEGKGRKVKIRRLK